MAKVNKAARHHKLFIIIAGSVLALGVIGFIAYDFWVMNQKTTTVLGVPGIITTDDADDPEKSSEGSETTQVAKEDLSSYKVAANAPRILTIDRLGIEARIRPMGLNSDKSIQAPKNIYDAGWYTGSSEPGENGAMFIDGHASGSSRYGLFAYLDTLKQGDRITVEKGDGTTLTYSVVHTATVSLRDVNMSEALAPYAGVTKGLTLMSCTGVWLKDQATLDRRVIVYAEQV